jgi:hypothetical protein
MSERFHRCRRAWSQRQLLGQPVIEQRPVLQVLLLLLLCLKTMIMIMMMMMMLLLLMLLFFEH